MAFMACCNVFFQSSSKLGKVVSMAIFFKIGYCFNFNFPSITLCKRPAVL